MPRSGEHYDLFISFAGNDRAWVEGLLIPQLGVPDTRIFTDTKMPPGANRIAAFEEAVLASRFSLLVLTPSYLADRWTQYAEQLAAFAAADARRDRLIPLKLEACEPPLHLQTLVALDCTKSANWSREIARLRDLLGEPERVLEPIPCPYPGMAAFQPEQADVFFGRDTEVKALAALVENRNTVLLIGPSGSGKSSLVLAGLIPTLARQAPGRWTTRCMRPGSKPMAMLGGTPAAAPRDAGRTLLCIDQLEEAFVLAGQEERDRFFQALLSFRQTPNCVLVLSLIAEYMADLKSSRLWPIPAEAWLEVEPLQGARLGEALSGPAAARGVYLEPRLLDRLLADGANEPGSQPLLSETMALLWSRMQGRLLTLEAYRSLGTEGRSGLAVVLSTQADAALAALQAAHRDATAWRILIRLVHFGEGRADTRRQQPVSALLTTADKPEQFEQTVRLLAERRLITISGDQSGPARRIDLAHEIMIACWPAFADRLARYRVPENARRRLESRAAEWAALGRGRAGLLDAADRREAERWLKSEDSQVLGYSREISDLVRRSRQALYWKCVVAALIVLTLGPVSWRYWSARKLAVRAAETLSEPSVSLWLAQESLARFPIASADATLAKAVQALEVPFSGHDKTVTAVRFNPDGTRLATASDDGTVRIWDARTRAEIFEHPLDPEPEHVPKHPVAAVEFSPDGSLLASADDHEVYLWRVQSGELLHPFPAGGRTPSAIAFVKRDAGRTLLAAGYLDGWVGLWDCATYQPVAGPSQAHQSAVTAMAVSPDGQVLATGSNDATVVFWDAGTWGRRFKPVALSGGVAALAFRPTLPMRIAIADAARIVVWDPESDRKEAEFTAGQVRSLTFRPPPGDELVAACPEHDCSIAWDPKTGRELRLLPTDSTDIRSLAFSSDGERLAVASQETVSMLYFDRELDERAAELARRFKMTPDQCAKHLARPCPAEFPKRAFWSVGSHWR